MQGIRIKNRKNRKAIVTREGMIPDNYGCICWKKRAETGNARETSWIAYGHKKGRRKTVSLDKG